MFERTADLYDVIYAHKDYGSEAAWLRDVIRARVPDARTLLDVACGTGKHVEHLRDDFACQGVDIDERLVAVASARCDVPIHVANMDHFDLGEQFDVVICMFSAIGYTRDLNGAIAAMARHVAADGVLIVEPWFGPDEWNVGTIHVLDNRANGMRVVRMGHSEIDGNVAMMNMHHLVGTAAGIEHVVETHRMTLFTANEYEAAFRAAALSYEVDRPGPSGRGALIGQPRRAGEPPRPVRPGTRARRRR